MWPHGLPSSSASGTFICRWEGHASLTTTGQTDSGSQLAIRQRAPGAQQAGGRAARQAAALSARTSCAPPPYSRSDSGMLPEASVRSGSRRTLFLTDTRTCAAAVVGTPGCGAHIRASPARPPAARAAVSQPAAHAALWPALSAAAAARLERLLVGQRRRQQQLQLLVPHLAGHAGRGTCKPRPQARLPGAAVHPSAGRSPAARQRPPARPHRVGAACAGHPRGQLLVAQPQHDVGLGGGGGEVGRRPHGDPQAAPGPALHRLRARAGGGGGRSSGGGRPAAGPLAPSAYRPGLPHCATVNQGCAEGSCGSGTDSALRSFFLLQRWCV